MTTTPQHQSRRRRRPGTNLLSGHRFAPSGETVADCNLVSLTPFTKTMGLGTEEGDLPNATTIMVKRGYESALAKILALKHLNNGDDSLVSDLDGLPERCPVRFGLDFVNTKLHIGTATIGLARRMSDVEKPPCVFLGSYRSMVSATTARVTSSYDYPQISGTSTSSYLDKNFNNDDANNNDDDIENERPLFSRTIPSTMGHADATVRYLANILDIQSLAVIYVADPYGSHFYQDLKEAAAAYCLSSAKLETFVLEGFSVLPNLSNLSDAMEFVKSTSVSHVFVAIHGEYLTDHTWMKELIAHGMNTNNDTNEGITWIFSDDFFDSHDSNWIFDSDDPLINAYRGTGILTANGRGSLIKPDGKYIEFAKQLKALFQEEFILANKHKHKHDKSRIENTNTFRTYLETMVSDKDDMILAIKFLDELLADETFLHPELLNHAISYEYEATIMAGLTICNHLWKHEQQQNLDGNDNDVKVDFEEDESDAIDDDGKSTSLETLFLDGGDFQKELVETSISGISGEVILHSETGTRLSNSTYYTFEKLVVEDFVEKDCDTGILVSKARLWKKKTAQLEPTLRKSIGGEENDCDDAFEYRFRGNCYRNETGEWVNLDILLQNNSGSADSNFMLPPSSIAARVDQQPSSSSLNNISINSERSVRITQSVFCGLPILAAIVCIVWTYKYQNQPIVRASKPLFLYLICYGVIIFAFSILPFSILGKTGEGVLVIEGDANTNSDPETISDDFERMMTVACSVSIWFRALGFAVVVSALFTKVYRIHKIAKLFQMTRTRVLTDFLVPLGITLSINIVILLLMTALDPVRYGFIEISEETSSLTNDENTYYYESCMFSDDKGHRFWIPLITWNVSILAFSLYKSWSVRNIDLEASLRFPAEGKQIFHALLGSLLVSLVGIPVTLVVRDRNDPIAIDLVESLIVFVFCNLILIEVFATKIKYVFRITLNTQQQNITVQNELNSGINDTNNNDNDVDIDDNGDNGDNGNGNNSSTDHSRTKEELKVENEELRKRNEALEEEVILYPSSSRSVNSTVKRFFGSLLGPVGSIVDDVLQTPPTEINTEQQQQQGQQLEDKAAAPASATANTPKKSFKFSCKKVNEDIDYSPPEILPKSSSLSDRTRIHLRDLYKPPASVVTTGRSNRQRDSKKHAYLASISNATRSGSTSDPMSSSGPQLYQPNNSGTSTSIHYGTSRSNYNVSVSNITHLGSSSYLRSSHNLTSSSTSKSNKQNSPDSNNDSFWGSTKTRPRGPEPEDSSTAPIQKKRNAFERIAIAGGVEPGFPRVTIVSKSKKSSSTTQGEQPRWSTETLFGGPSNGVGESRFIFRPRPPSPLMGTNGASSSLDNYQLPADIPQSVTIYQSYYYSDDLQPEPPPLQSTTLGVHPRQPSMGFDEGIEPPTPEALHDPRAAYRHEV